MKQNINHTDFPWISSFTGKKVDLRRPQLQMISIYDIAHALSMYCRYVGHVESFYSVGEHSIYCSNLGLTPSERLENLLHDATETYLGDVSRPLKQLLPKYKEIERAWDIVIREKFGLPMIETEQCNDIDGIMCVTEMKNLFKLDHPENPIAKVSHSRILENFDFDLEFHSMEQVEMKFLDMFFSLYKEVHGVNYAE